MESFSLGHRLSEEDLLLNLYGRYISSKPNETFPFTPYSIKYNVEFLNTKTNKYIIVGPIARKPIILDTGKIQPNFIIDYSWNIGTYRILWIYNIKEESLEQEFPVEFSVVTDGIKSARDFEMNHKDICATLIIS